MRKTSLVTEIGGSAGFFDRYTCAACGAIGKRYGFDNRVTPDRKFRGLKCGEVADKVARKRRR